MTHSKSFALVHNKVWTPTLLSSIHVGWNDLAWVNTFPNQSLTSVGIPGVSTSYPGFSEISITGYTGLGVSNVPNSDASQDRQLSGDLTWTKGAHNIKFGVQANWLQTNFLSSQAQQRDLYLQRRVHQERIRGFSAGGGFRGDSFELVVPEAAHSVHAFFCAGRLEGEQEADAEHRVALRVEPAADTNREYDFEFR